MATFYARLNLTKCVTQHIGPILLGRFLETGYIHMSLGAREDKYFEKKLDSKPATRGLVELFVSAAKGSGLASECESWNFERDSSGFLIWDSKRVSHSEALGFA